MTFAELFTKVNDLGAGMHQIDSIDIQIYNHLHQVNLLVNGRGCNIVWDSEENPTIYRVCNYIANYDQPIHFTQNDQIPAWCRIPNSLM